MCVPRGVASALALPKHENMEGVTVGGLWVVGVWGRVAPLVLSKRAGEDKKLSKLLEQQYAEEAASSPSQRADRREVWVARRAADLAFARMEGAVTAAAAAGSPRPSPRGATAGGRPASARARR